MSENEAPAPENDDQERVVTFKEAAGVDDAALAEIDARARQLYEDRQYMEARALFRGLATIDPTNVDYYRMYAAASVGDGDHNGAIEALNMALRFLEIARAGPEYLSELLAFKATILIKADRKVEAHRVAEEALALGAEDAHWRADLEKGLGDLEGALKLTLQRAPHQETSDVVALRLEEAQQEGHPLAWVFGYSDDELLSLHKDAVALVRQGNFESARRILEGLCALDGAVPLFHTSLGTVCELIGDFPAAEAAFDQAVRVSDGVPSGDDLVATARLRRGVFLAQHGDPTKARQDLEAALAAPIPEEDREEAQKALEALDGEKDNPPDDRADNQPGSVAEAGSESARGPPAS